MSRAHALTVILKEPLKDEDLDRVVDAIEMIIGVAGVEIAEVNDVSLMTAKMHLRTEFGKKFWDLFHKELSG